MVPDRYVVGEKPVTVAKAREKWNPGSNPVS
jgi:hypothetical protein